MISFNFCKYFSLFSFSLLNQNQTKNFLMKSNPFCITIKYLQSTIRRCLANRNDWRFFSRDAWKLKKYHRILDDVTYDEHTTPNQTTIPWLQLWGVINNKPAPLTEVIELVFAVCVVFNFLIIMCAFLLIII